MATRNQIELKIRKNRIWIRKYQGLKEMALAKGDRQFAEHCQSIIDQYQGGIEKWENADCQ